MTSCSVGDNAVGMYSCALGDADTWVPKILYGGAYKE